MISSLTVVSKVVSFSSVILSSIAISLFSSMLSSISLLSLLLEFSASK
ncbi:hypothetical protein [Brachyspira pilosicoli]|nr:hypothetical protein [Brachyspira pilosicoli]